MPSLEPPSTKEPATMSAQAQMRALLDQLMGTARDGSVYLCQPTSICKGVAEKPHVHRAGTRRARGSSTRTSESAKVTFSTAARMTSCREPAWTWESVPRSTTWPSEQTMKLPPRSESCFLSWTPSITWSRSSPTATAGRNWPRSAWPRLKKRSAPKWRPRFVLCGVRCLFWFLFRLSEVTNKGLLNGRHRRRRSTS
uniref:LUC7-like (S. cerevisiae) n=1 Tax=Hippocampus comes TaxID=109280 RepID=A0A3Q2ZK45_HIPCM